MATSGEKFLNLAKAETLTITSHALARITEFSGFEPTQAVARAMFRRAEQLKPHEMFPLGYRPAYVRRKEQGVQSWYFRFHLFNQELIAVIQEGSEPGEYVWVTTYGITTESSHRRVFEPEVTVCA